MDEADAYAREDDDGRTVEPLHLTFSVHAFPVSGTILTWDAAKRELRLSDRFDTTGGRVLPTPTRAQWKAFRILLDKAKVWEWQSEYVDDTVCDGGGWRLEIAFADRRIGSGGSNAYPGEQGASPFPGSDFDMLCTAILMLSNSEFPGLGDAS